MREYAGRVKKIKSGIGIGYVSVMMIFAVICLTILAVLAFQAASSDEKLSERNSDFTREYYAADTKAKRILMELDNAAVAAAESPFFEDSFTELSAESGASLTRTADGFRAEYSVELNERLSLFVGAVFYSVPAAHGGERFEIVEWRTASASESVDKPLNVWDGNG